VPRKCSETKLDFRVPHKFVANTAFEIFKDVVFPFHSQLIKLGRSTLPRVRTMALLVREVLAKTAEKSPASTLQHMFLANT
jgi:hypothetical protein